MQIRIAVPVVFTTKAANAEASRLALVFIPTDFAIPEAEEGTAPLVATVDVPRMHAVTHYRVYDDTLYGRYMTTRSALPSIETHVADIVRDAHRKVAESVREILDTTKQDDVFPKDSREIMSLARIGDDEYRRYAVKVADRMAKRSAVSAIENGVDFEEARRAAVETVAGVIAANVFVGNDRYRKSAGLALSVEAHYNNTVTVSTYEMWSATKWNRGLGDFGPSGHDTNTYFFSIDEKAEAVAFAEDLGRRIGERVVVETDEEPKYHVPVEAFPSVDMRYAELVRSAKDACHMVGTEIARRIRNQESSIFTDDRKLRYAFDRLSEILETAEAFGEPDERLELAVIHLLGIVQENAKEIDARYRGLATGYRSGFEHLANCLSRWEDRSMDISLQIAQYRPPAI